MKIEELPYLACALSSGEVIIYDVPKRKIITTVAISTLKAFTFKVSWNEVDTDLLVASSKEGKM